MEIAKQHYEHGVELIEQQDWSAAIRELREVIRLVPHHAGAHFLLGDTLRGAGDLDSAVAEYRASLGLDLKDVDASWAHYYIGVIQQKKR
jgi:Flp pilus assembly protein TadD